MKATAAILLVMAAIAMTASGSIAAPVDQTPSKQTLEESSKDDCEGVSSVVQRCAPKVNADVAAPKADDALTRSRAKTKAGFDRIDRQNRNDALKGAPPSVNTPVGDAQQLGGVTVTGKAADDKPSVEDVLQRAIGPTGGVPNGNGTVTKYTPNGTRYECVEKCVGPACCIELRATPNPAREVNSIGR